jgi:intracellular septation protein
MTPKKNKPGLGLLFGGILPVIAFTVIEEKFGIIWGVIAGMVFSVGEMAWEWARDRRISSVTLGVSLMILVLGGISLWANDGIWFKLQPALSEAAFCLLLLGSLILGKPFLVAAMEKQGTVLPPAIRAAMPGLTLRLALFFGFHAILATWAAFHWSTSAWALLKGVGFTGSMILYMGIEILWIRRVARRSFGAPSQKR